MREENLGTQVTVVNVLSGALVPRDGGVLVCAALYGDEGRLAVLPPGGAQVPDVFGLAGARGAYATLPVSDGNVYLGTNPNGHLYRYTPGDGKLEDIGYVLGADTAPLKDTFVWQLAEGEEGWIYGGIYPEARLFGYNFRTGEFRDFGSIAPGEQYLRSLLWSPGEKRLYAGIGSRAALIAFDPATGNAERLTLKELDDKSFVYTLGTAGRFIIAKTTPGDEGTVVDRGTMQCRALRIPITSAQFSPPVSGTERVFFSSEKRLILADLASAMWEDTGIVLDSEARAFAFDSDGTLLVLTAMGGLYRYNVETRLLKSSILPLPRQNLRIQSLAAGPDGRIYTSGFLTGGIGIHDPVTGQQEEYHGTEQAEGMACLGGRLYLGVYPGARFYRFDPAKPWSVATGNPEFLFTLGKHGQDRPFAMVGAEEEGILFAGTVPDYGKLGGALAAWHAGSGKLDVYTDPIAGQSIVTLTQCGGMLVGGTSIWGGLGIPPREKEARLFLWDIARADLAWQGVPVPGARVITGLLTDSDGLVWGWAEGILFVFDPARREVVFTKDVFQSHYGRELHLWIEARMVEGNGGRICGTTAGRVFCIDKATRGLTVLAEGEAHLAARDRNGAFYYAVRDELRRIVFK